MEARAAAGAIAHKRVKRAMGLLRAAARDLAPEARELDVVAELELPAGAPAGEVLEAVELARRGRPVVTVVILARSPGGPE